MINAHESGGVLTWMSETEKHEAMPTLCPNKLLIFRRKVKRIELERAR